MAGNRISPARSAARAATRQPASARTAPATARRADHVEDTRRAILAAARRAFAKKGYGETSLEDIVGPARLTKGALYHHFTSKAAVFEALYVEMSNQLLVQVSAALAGAGDDPWRQIIAALHAFFEASAEPDYVRIVLHDAPHVLGPIHGRELDQSIGLTFVTQMVQRLCDAGLLPAMPVAATARMLLAVTGELAIAMAYATDQEVARREGTQVVLTLLEALRARAEADRSSRPSRKRG
jgi:AcrR family transcriptional regulator